MRLSAVLIVRDEEAHLAACLSSVSSLVDEVVVVDTGSTDSTVQIAQQAGALLIRERWTEDFAQARNVGLARAQGDWILYIDADERVALEGDLGQALASSDLIAARVAFRASTRLSPYLEYRLFRNRDDVRFRGAIHETILPDLERVARREGLRVGRAPLSIQHLGYEHDLSAKHRRNLPLLRCAVEEDPSRLYLWHTLGEAELGLGDAAAAARAWDHGLELAAQKPPVPGEARLLADRIELARQREGEASLASALLERAESRHADDPLVLWAGARSRVAEGRTEEARARLERLIDIGRDGPPPGDLGYDLALFRELPRALLGICRLMEGLPAEAARLLREAESFAPENEEIRLKRELAERRAASTR